MSEQQGSREDQPAVPTGAEPEPVPTALVAPPAAQLPVNPALANPQQQWAWVQPRPQIRLVETEPLEYHRLLRGARRYRWWKPLLAVVLGFVYYFTFSVVIALLVIVPYSFSMPGGFTEEGFTALTVLDTQNPWSMFLALGSVALMIPAVWLAYLSVGLTPIGRGWSVALRVRWGWIWRTVLPAIVAMVIMTVVGGLLDSLVSLITPGASAAAEKPLPDIDLTLALWSLAIALVLVPFQATAEELVFRGVFMQTLGAWLGGVKGSGVIARVMRGPWVVILVPAIAFGFAHIYDVWGWFAVVMLAVTAGWLTWRTGGLEAAITIHVVNNLVAFGFMSFGVGGETAQTPDTGGGFGSLFAQLLGLGFYAWWVNRSFMHRDGRRSRIDLVEAKDQLLVIAQTPPGGAPLQPQPQPQPQPGPSDGSAPVGQQQE